ncbi:MAG: hypothetical protein AAGD22_14925 [Verrucomicrobiota bacterium]
MKTLTITLLCAVLGISVAPAKDSVRLHKFVTDAGVSKTAFFSFFMDKEEAHRRAQLDPAVFGEEFAFEYEQALESLRDYLDTKYPERKHFKVYEYTVSWRPIYTASEESVGFPYCFIRSEVVVPNDNLPSGWEIKPGYHVILRDGTVIDDHKTEWIDFRPNPEED